MACYRGKKNIDKLINIDMKDFEDLRRTNSANCSQATSRLKVRY
jgi:hypothetical protein